MQEDSKREEEGEQKKSKSGERREVKEEGRVIHNLFSFRFFKLAHGPPTGGGGRSVIQQHAFDLNRELIADFDVTTVDDDLEHDDNDIDVADAAVVLEEIGEENREVSF